MCDTQQATALPRNYTAHWKSEGFMPFLKEKNVCLLRTNHSISFQMSLNSSTPGFLRCGESVSSTLHPELALSSHRNERSRKETKGLSLPSWLLAADLQQPAWPSKAAMSCCSLGQNAQPRREGCDDALLKYSFSCHLNRVPGFVFATALKVPAEVFALQPQGMSEVSSVHIKPGLALES